MTPKMGRKPIHVENPQNKMNDQKRRADLSTPGDIPLSNSEVSGNHNPSRGDIMFPMGFVSTLTLTPSSLTSTGVIQKKQQFFRSKRNTIDYVNPCHQTHQKPHYIPM